MLLQTLKTMITAGQDALQRTCSLPVTGVNISQVRQGKLTFPALAQYKVVRGVLNRIHLGCDSRLIAHLSNQVGAAGGNAGVEALVANFLDQLLEDMESRNPRGELESLDVGPVTLHTRGVRTFGIRLESDGGQLYMLAEIPSKLELEQAKGSDFLTSMMQTYLPRDWINRETLENRRLIENYLIFLRKVEGDIQVEVPLDDGDCTVHTGVLLEQTTVDGQRMLKICLDLSTARAEPQPGDQLQAKVGLMDRSFEFPMTYHGPAEYDVVGGASLGCCLVSAPDTIEIAQRRRSFRIAVSSTVPVEVARPEDDNVTRPWSEWEDTSDFIRGNLADLSFSGARLTGAPGAFAGAFSEGDKVVCRLFFPGEPKPMKLVAVVRRCSTRLRKRDDVQDDLGLEFLITPDVDRSTLEVIRQYVLTEQRVWLSQRVNVAGLPT